MKGLRLVLGVIAMSLAIIASVMSYRLWADYTLARQAESALAQLEDHKPERVKAELPSEAMMTSQSPTRLVVSLDANGLLKLNEEEAGAISDLSQLRARLEHIFRERGEQQPERTVLIRMPRSVKHPEVSKVIDAVKEAGAHPVGLQADEL
jgi:biopolymer transport protein ExbD